MYQSLSSNPLFKWRNKSKYWDLYGDLYSILTEKGSGRFPQMYAEEFVRGYERQIAEFKRLGGIDEDLKDTVVLKESDLVTDVPDEQLVLNESATEALTELEKLDESSNEQVVEEDDFTATVTFEGVSLEELPDEETREEPDEAKG